MYFTGACSRLVAIDVMRGEGIRQYDALLPEGILPCCDVVNRGAAIHGDTVICGTLDARIVALNKDTGDVMRRDKIADYRAGFPAPWNSHLRGAGTSTEDAMGDPLHAASRLGIDPENGAIKWHFQITPREGWDHDGATEVVAFDGPDGEALLATADRNGSFHVLTTEDGTFVDGYPFVKNITWADGLDENGRPIFVEETRPGDPTAAADGNTDEIVFSAPGFLGAKTWMPMVYSQNTGLFCIPSNA